MKNDIIRSQHQGGTIVRGVQKAKILCLLLRGLFDALDYLVSR